MQELTRLAREASERTNIEPVMALTIDGVSTVFSTEALEKRLLYGDNVNYGDNNLFYGGVSPLEDNLAYIKKEGTTSNITQQIQPDRPGGSSVSVMTVSMIDKNQELTDLFSSGEFLYRKANIFIGFKGTAFPDDFIRIFTGLITDVGFPQGACEIVVSHPEDKKRRELFIPWVSAAAAPIDAIQTTIPVETLQGLIASQDVISLYAQIDDEIVKISSFSNNILTVIRGQFGTVAASHDFEAEIESRYRIQGRPLALALKLMLSGLGFFGDRIASAFNQVAADRLIMGAIYFDVSNIEKELNLVLGDTIEVTNADNPANNFTDQISGFGTINGGSFIRVNRNLETSINQIASVRFKSKHDVLNEGIALDADQVDLIQFQYIESLIGTQLPDLDFLINEEMNVKDFIDKELFFPFGLYSVPRSGASSVAVTLPPLSTLGTKVIDAASVTNAAKLKISRSTNRNFYNSVVYRFNKDPLEDKFKAGVIITSEDSNNRIKTGNKVLTIESAGLRRAVDIQTYLQRQGERILDRYKFAAESISVDVNFKTGFNIDVADTVIFGQDLQITDIKFQTRDFKPRIMEVINRSFNFFSGKITLSLLDTAFELDGRYGVVSPSSIVESGTTTRIKLARSFTNQDRPETFKWADLIGLKIKIHSEDYTYSHTTTIIGIDPIDESVLLVLEIPLAPSQGFTVDLADYDDSLLENQKLAKDIFVFFTPQDTVLGGISETEFNSSDPSLYFIGSVIEVKNYDFSIASPNVKVIEIDGSKITTDRPLGFIPDNTMFVDLIGFTDKSVPYRII